MLRKDYIPGHKELELYQDDSMFMINSDTMALGEFIEILHKDNVCDFGTNQGALMLYASLFKPKSITGVDINSEALKLAKMNMELNNITNYRLINVDIKDYKEEFLYDVIICNPPYFKTETKNMSNNYYKNIAKHELKIDLDSLIKSISRNLRDSGTLYFLFLTSRLDEVLYKLREYNLNPKKIKFVYDNNKELSNVFLVKAVKNSLMGLEVVKPLIIKR